MTTQIKTVKNQRKILFLIHNQTIMRTNVDYPETKNGQNKKMKIFFTELELNNGKKRT